MKILNTTFFLVTLFVVLFVAGLAFSQCAGCQTHDHASSDVSHEAVRSDAEEDEDEGVAQTQCPVMGGEINKEFYADHDGKRVYFCCQGCVETFKKDPEKYLEKMEAEGVVLEDAPVEQTACPVSGKPIDTAIYTDYEGERVYFCCAGCKAEFEKNPTKYLKKS